MINKKLKNKITTTCSALILATTLTSLITIPTFAANNDFSNEKVTVCNYLDAIMSNDLEKAVEISDFPGFSEEEELVNLQELMSNPNNILESYEILNDGEIQGNDNIEFRIVLNYKNGKKEIMPVETSIENDNIIVQLSEDIKYIETIHEGEYIERPIPYVQLVKWDCNLEEFGVATRFSNSFSALSASYVDLNYQSTCNVKFTVVENTIGGNKSVSESKDGYITSSPTKLRLSLLSGKKFDDVKLRIHLTNSSGGRTFGEVYAY